MFSSTSLDPGNATYDELEFLRYFYAVAGDSMGPADQDIYEYIKRDYEKFTGNKVPKEYTNEEFE